MEPYLRLFTDARISKRRRTTLDSHQNRDMNDETYRLRRLVMNYIYRAKKLLNGDLPRIDVRIVDLKPEAADRKTALGVAYMGLNSIFIPAKSIEEDYNLHYIVFHEILHAAFGVEHDESSPLMRAYYREDLSEEEIDSLFVKHVEKIRNKKIVRLTYR